MQRSGLTRCRCPPDSSGTLRAFGRHRCTAGSRQVEVDCAALEYVSSAGLRVLLLANRQAAEADAALTFVNVSDDVMEVLRMTGFSDLLQIN